jgi:hypothetical protein
MFLFRWLFGPRVYVVSARHLVAVMQLAELRNRNIQASNEPYDIRGSRCIR